MTVHLTTDKMKSYERIRIIAALFLAHLKGENLAGYFDVNKLSEDFFCVILNKTYGLNLVNINKTGKLNFKAIDLADEDSGTTYQITSENSRKKIKKNLEGYEDDKRYEKYPHLRFLILDGTKPSNISDLKRNKGFNFDPGTDVICMKELLLAIELLEDQIVNEILDYLTEQMPLWEILTEQSVDDEILLIVDDIIKKSHNTKLLDGLDYLETSAKIDLNFKQEEDRQYIADEYQRCLPRFKSIETIINKYGPEYETVLQSAMSDMYNKLKQDKTNTNRDIFNKMIEGIEIAAPATENQAIRRLAIKSLIMFHFEDCTIFEKTLKEKEGQLV